MPQDAQKDFTVKFGNYARTIDYEDAAGHVLFTFDIGSKFDFKNPNGPEKIHFVWSIMRRRLRVV
jgi:hypothetical protein